MDILKDLADYPWKCLRISFHIARSFVGIVALAGLFGLSHYVDQLTPMVAFILALGLFVVVSPFVLYRRTMANLRQVERQLAAFTGRRLVDVERSYVTTEYSPTIRVTSRVSTDRIKVRLVLGGLHEPIRYLRWPDDSTEIGFAVGESHDLLIGRLEDRTMIINCEPPYTVSEVPHDSRDEDRCSFKINLRFSAAGVEYFSEAHVQVNSIWGDGFLRSAGIGDITVLSSEASDDLLEQRDLG